MVCTEIFQRNKSSQLPWQRYGEIRYLRMWFSLVDVCQPFKPSRCIKASFYIPENRLNFPTTKGFSMKIY